MKRFIIFSILISILLVSTSHLLASEAGGKNLLNPDHFELTSGEIVTHTPFVLPAGTYTYSMPMHSELDAHFDLRIYSTHTNYINESSENLGECSSADHTIMCTFTLTSSEALNIEIIVPDPERQGNIVRYLEGYNFENFQLEGGSQGTAYEPYYNVGDPLRYFQGEETIVVNYHEPLSVETIISDYVEAHDEIDGDVSDSIYVISDTYTTNADSVGAYAIYLGAYDGSGNEASLRLNMIVIDTVAPVITQLNDIVHPEGHTQSIWSLIDANFTIVDDHDGTITDYTVLTDPYTEGAKGIGFYEITFEARDASGNVATKTFTIELTDNTPPNVVGSSTVRYGINDTVTPETLFSIYQYSDNYSAEEDILIYLANESVIDNFDTIGFYEVNIYFEDEAGNKTLKILEVEIYDDLPPEITGPKVLEICYSEVLTIESIKNYYEVYDDIETLTLDDLIIETDNYSASAHLPGIYTIKFSVSDAEHTTYHTLTMNVVDNVPPVFSVDSSIMLLLSDLEEETLFSALSNHDTMAYFKPVSMHINHQETIEDKTYYNVSLENAIGELIEKDVLVDLDVTQTFPVLEVTTLTTLGIIGILVFKKLKRS